MSIPNPSEPQQQSDQVEAEAKYIQRFNIGCLLILLGPFLLAGVLIVIYAATHWGDSDRVKVWVVLGMGVAFTAVAGLPLLAQQTSRSWIAGRLRLQKKYPGQPWKWREDWAKGVISERGLPSPLNDWIRAAFFTVGFGAIGFNLSSIVGYQYLRENYPAIKEAVSSPYVREGNDADGALLLLVVGGVGFGEGRPLLR